MKVLNSPPSGFRRLSSQFAAVGNVGAGTDNLMSYIIAAGLLSTNGDVIRVHAWGRKGANANAKTINMLLGGTSVLGGAVTLNTQGDWRIEAVIVRNAAGTAMIAVQLFDSDVSYLPVLATSKLLNGGNPAVTWANAQTIQFTATGTADNDVTQTGLLVDFEKAA